jgi:hypothetical protein
MRKERIYLDERLQEPPLSEGHVLNIYDRNDRFEFRDWLLEGYRNGWIGAPVCHTHDGLPVADEDKECVHVIRLYEDETIKRGVETNHLPSQWRNNMFDIHDLVGD